MKEMWLISALYIAAARSHFSHLLSALGTTFSRYSDPKFFHFNGILSRPMVISLSLSLARTMARGQLSFGLFTLLKIDLVETPSTSPTLVTLLPLLSSQSFRTLHFVLGPFLSLSVELLSSPKILSIGFLAFFRCKNVVRSLLTHTVLLSFQKELVSLVLV